MSPDKREHEPEHDDARPSPLVQGLLTGLVITVGVLLVFALIYVLVIRHAVLHG